MNAAEQRRELRRYAKALGRGLGFLGLPHVEDPRRWFEWPLWQLLISVFAGLTSGCGSLKEVEELTAQLSPGMRRKLRIPRRVPDTTLRDLLVGLSLDSLREMLRRQVRAAHRRKQLRPDELPFGMIAIDGKHTVTRRPDEVYAQRQGDHAVVRTLTCALTSSPAAVCIDAAPIPKELNECSAFPSVLDELVDTYGRLKLFNLVSADAGITSKANAARVVDHGLHTVFTSNVFVSNVFAIKNDQPTLIDEAARLLERRSSEQAAAETIDRLDNNTVDIRRVWLTDEMAGYHEWNHLHTVLRVQRLVRRDDGTIKSCEDRYFVSSCETDTLSPEQWLRAVRWHWRVENDCHGVFDNFLREDERPWLHTAYGMLVIMLLRRVAYNLLVLYRNVVRRGERKGDIPWRELLSRMRWALVASTADVLEGLGAHG